MKGKEFLFRERVCPVCKTRFIPTAEWVYKKYYGNSERIFCSWKCLRKTETARGSKIDRRERIIQAIRDGLTNSEITLLLEEKGTTVSYWRKKIEEEDACTDCDRDCHMCGLTLEKDGGGYENW